MALIPLAMARRQAVRHAQKMCPPQILALLTYKRDRGVVIHCLAENAYKVCEYGFVHDTIVVSEERLGKLLKTIIKREFPRSHKVRLLKLASPGELPIHVHCH